MAEEEVKADRSVAADEAAEVEQAAHSIPEKVAEAVAPVVAAVESVVETVKEVYEEVKTPQLIAEEEGRTVFVGGLSWNLDNDWLKEEVEKLLEVSEGVVNVRIARDHMGRSKGCVHALAQGLDSTDDLRPDSDSSSLLLRN